MFRVVTGKPIPDPEKYDTHKKTVLALLAGSTADSLTFDEIRAAVGKSATQLPDGHIQQLAIDAGYTCDTK